MLAYKSNPKYGNSTFVKADKEGENIISAIFGENGDYSIVFWDSDMIHTTIDSL